MDKIYLSRRNLLTLLNKLDAVKAGKISACSLIKNDNTHSNYAQTMESCMVTAVEDENYYDRPAGQMHPRDDPNTNGKLESLN